ncbi:MAG: ABC transporter substrate-binding protein [Gammaproteobacteria bacterium]|nr:ABC transporter substrate-binding protein [Gammaproteobacteria bacterium]
MRISAVVTLFLGLLLGSLPFGYSNEQDAPLAVVQQTAERVLQELAVEGDRYRADESALYAMVRELVFPHFDFERTAQWVLGRYWRGATEQQQHRFVEEFSTLMLRTYAQALREYDDETIHYLPLVMEPGAKRVTVQTEILRRAGPKIPIDYRLIDRGEGWRVYDVVIENVSLVITYRSEYAGVIESKGLDGLIEMLAERNQGRGGA